MWSNWKQFCCRLAWSVLFPNKTIRIQFTKPFCFVKKYSMGSKWIQKLWFPFDTYINESEANKEQILKQNSKMRVRMLHWTQCLLPFSSPVVINILFRMKLYYHRQRDIPSTVTRCIKITRLSFTTSDQYLQHPPQSRIDTPGIYWWCCMILKYVISCF
jgi:hypothetical protein